MKPIGVIHSAFRDRRGTPRQGCLVPHSTAYIEFYPFVNAVSSVSGLEEFSHIWVLGYFHENTNVGKTGGISAKIKPPRLRGEKVGIYSTRTPHRHNAISLSLAQIDKIESVLSKGKTVTRLWLSGIDLIHSTPILDVKPYIPYCDTVENARIANWVAEEDKQIGFRFDKVIIPDEIVDKYNKYIAKKLEFYSPEHFLEALREVLKTDIRSEYQRQQQQNSHEPQSFNFRLDVVNIQFAVHSQDTVTVEDLNVVE